MILSNSPPSLPALGMQLAFVLPLSMPLLVPVGQYRLNWFYPAMMILLGAHYLPFVFPFGLGLVPPFPPNTRERRLQGALVPEPRPSTVRAQALQVRRVEDEARHPLRFLHDLLREFAERVPELLRRAGRHGQPSLGFGGGWRQEDTAARLG